jgi:signal transduction histidine kinase
VISVWGSGVFWVSIALAVACGVATWLAVQLGRARRRCRDAMEERTWLMEKERESAAQVAVDEERARIARELHDIVSHNVSMMLIQAGAARQVLTAAATSRNDDADPVQAEDALLAVESAGRATMTELRHLLGVLAPAQDGIGDDGLTPQPTLARLSPLVDRIAFAGLPVEMRISGEPRTLPAGVDMTASTSSARPRTASRRSRPRRRSSRTSSSWTSGCRRWTVSKPRAGCWRRTRIAGS